MDQKQGHAFANLREEDVLAIRNLEENISESSGKQTILIAYREEQ